MGSWVVGVGVGVCVFWAAFIKRGAKNNPGPGGYPENQHKYEQVQKAQARATIFRTNVFRLMRGDLLKKWMAQRLGVY